MEWGFAMTDTRKNILRVLKSQRQATVAELAEAVGLSPIAVRHHLSALQAEGLIQASEVRHGVGRPYHVYRLTEAGEEQFPQKYVRLAERLLGELKATLPPAAIEQLFARMAGDLAAEVSARVAGLPDEDKVVALIEALGEEGFVTTWEREQSRDGFCLTGVSCPYIHVGQSHPEVCQFDIVLMSSVMQAPVERSTCMIDGDPQCTFHIPTTRTEAA
jgi:predicted ArsR family transcriptional regulator